MSETLPLFANQNQHKQQQHNHAFSVPPEAVYYIEPQLMNHDQLLQHSRRKTFYVKLLMMLTTLLLVGLVVMTLFAFGPFKPAQPVAISYFSPIDNQVHYLIPCNLTADPRLCPVSYPSFVFKIHPISGSPNNSFHLWVDGYRIGGNLYLYPLSQPPAEVWLVPTGHNTNFYIGLTIAGQNWGGILMGNNEVVSLPDWAPPGSSPIEFSIIPYIPNILF